MTKAKYDVNNQPETGSNDNAPVLTKRRRKIFFKNSVTVLVGLVLLVGVGSFLWYTKQQSPNKLPKSIVSSVNFPIYYPGSMLAGYQYKKNSVSIQNGVLFYNLESGKHLVTISEQAIPQKTPDFNALQKLNPNFKQVEVPAGQAITGIDPASRRPLAIIETNTTLIDISANKDTPSDVINRLVQSLGSLAQ